MWVWFGGMIMALGGLVVMWPQAQRARKQSGYVTELRPARPAAAEEPREVAGVAG